MDSTTGVNRGGGLGSVPAAASAALGNNTKFAAAFDDPAVRIRLDRFAAQEVARELLPASRLAWCLRSRVLAGVGVHYSPSTERASYSGLIVCGLRWLCPVCAAKIAEHTRELLQETITAWRKRGGKVALVTLTLSHARTDALGTLLDALTGAYRAMVGNRPYKRFKKAVALSDVVRFLEINFGNAYGWHPHFHVLWFLEGDMDRGAAEDRLYELWRDALAAEGRSTSREHGVKIQWADNDVDAYVTKFGRAWTAASEVAKGHAKQGRADSHYTAFELLQLAGVGKRWAGKRFKEYASATRSVNQMRGPTRLRKKLGLDVALDDEAAAAATEDDRVLLALLISPEWRAVCYYHKRGELLEVARSGDREKVQSYVDSLLARYRKKYLLARRW